MANKPFEYTDLMRKLHVNAHQLDLGPRSRAGVNGHGLISQSAKDVFGVRSTADLTFPQLQKITDFLLTNKRLPKKGEL